MILIVGGAGYIGSHINQMLCENGYQTVVFDNLVYGHREAVMNGILEEGDLSDTGRLDVIFKKYKICLSYIIIIWHNNQIVFYFLCFF